MAAALVLSVPSSGWTQTTPLAPNQPRTFDYEERSGFPLASEERLLSFADEDALLRNALQVAPVAAMRDWEDVLERLEYDAPPGREQVRVVRVYSDQPVFVKDGVALLPDPTRPEDEVSADDFVPARDCEPSAENLKAARCVALHRDHVQNRDSIAVLLSARIVIFKGVNRTGGQSLITLTENLWMQSRDDRVDLSARSDRAPGIGQGDLYRVYDGTLPGLGESEDNPLTQLVGIDTLIGGEAPPWSFPTAPDLAWQYEIARRAVPDYDWSERDPCVGAQDPRACFLAREPRGLAGLPGGNWFGVSRRATALQAESFGQPGGHGGPGVAPPKGITCAPPPVRGPRCGFLGPACDALNDPPENPFCSAGQLASEDPPNDNDLCACDDRCEQTACNVNYAEDDPTGTVPSPAVWIRSRTGFLVGKVAPVVSAASSDSRW